jgi:ribokinase
MQLEIPVATCLAAAERARSAGSRVVVNAAPLTDAADPTLRALLRSTDVLVVNQIEAATLVGTSVDGNTGAWAAPAEELRSLGPSVVVITLGREGAMVADVEGTVRVRSAPVRAVDSTGAGDAFCGVLAASVSAGGRSVMPQTLSELPSGSRAK